MCMRAGRGGSQIETPCVRPVGGHSSRFPRHIHPLERTAAIELSPAASPQESAVASTTSSWAGVGGESAGFSPRSDSSAQINPVLGLYVLVMVFKGETDPGEYRAG